MPNLKWDETDLLWCLEVEPEIEEHGVCHTYNVKKTEISLELQLWQHESIIEVTLTNEKKGSTITSFAIFVRGKIKPEKCGSLLFTDCTVLPSRFSYVDLGGLEILEECKVGYDIRLSVKPEIQIEYLRK